MTRIETTKMRAENEAKTLGESLQKILGTQTEIKLNANAWRNGIQPYFRELLATLRERQEHEAAERLETLMYRKQFNPDAPYFYYNKSDEPLEYSVKLDLTELDEEAQKRVLDEIAKIDEALYINIDKLDNGRYVVTYPRHTISKDLKVKAIKERDSVNVNINPIIRKIAEAVVKEAGVAEFKKGEFAKRLVTIEDGKLVERKPDAVEARVRLGQRERKERVEENKGSLSYEEMLARAPLPNADNAKQAIIDALKGEIGRVEENYDEAREFFVQTLINKGDLETARGETKRKYKSEYIVRGVLTEVARWASKYPVEHEELKKRSEEVVKLAEAVKKLQGEIQTLGGKLEETQKALQAEKTRAETAEAKVKELEFANASLAAQRDKLATVLENTQNELQVMTTRAEKAEADAQAKDKEIAELRAKIAELEAKAKTAEATVKSETESENKEEKSAGRFAGLIKRKKFDVNLTDKKEGESDERTTKTKRNR